jgi:hypothetical protein
LTKLVAFANKYLTDVDFRITSQKPPIFLVYGNIKNAGNVRNTIGIKT